jgi:Abnormal spindle-like microcephaly-assoc'd, ASPM-SPD-2-Hydin
MKNSVRLALCALVCLIFGSVSVEAQNITTVAGSGPVPPATLPATTSSVGSPVAVRFDTAGNMFVLDNKYSRILKVNAAGQISVYAGNGTAGFSGDGLIATSGQMNGPSGMCIQPITNNLFIADSDNNVIREVTAADGIMHTFAGVPSTNPSFGGDGGVATAAHFHFPDGCSFDSHGNLYIADRGNNEIRVVVATAGTPIAATVVGSIYNFAGAGGAGPGSPASGFSADGTVAQGALLDGPFDVAVDASDNVFYADLGNNFNPDGSPAAGNNNVIRAVLAADNKVHTVAGKVGVYGHDNNMLATNAAINQPKGLSFDAGGNLYFCDTANHVIRKVSPSVGGNISVVAGTLTVPGFSGDGHAATSANLSFPAGTTIDTTTGNLFIADEDSNALRVVPAVSFTGFGSTVAQGNIGTLAGNGHASYGGNGVLATIGEFNAPAGLVVDASGNIIVADSNNDVIRKVTASTGFLSDIAGLPENNGFLNGAFGTNALNGAFGVALDASGAVYFADTSNCLVRKIGAGGTTTIAGKEPSPINPDNPLANHPVCGFLAASGPAVGTTLGKVQSVAVDSNGNVFFSDSTNNVIWEVPSTTTTAMTAGNAYIVVGTQSTTGAFGGEGNVANSAAVKLNSPMGIFIDIYDNLFIADAGNSRVREVPAIDINSLNAGSIYTIAGTGTAGVGPDGGLATSSKVQFPFAIVVDHAENVFFSDTTFTLAATTDHTQSTQTIREISGTTGNISTVAGITSATGFSGDGGAATSAHLDFPLGLALKAATGTTANLLISDSINNRVRSVAGIADISPKPIVSFTPNPLVFNAQTQGTTSAPLAITVSNTGGAPLAITAFNFGGADAADFTLGTETCTTAAVAPGANCTVNVKFTPGALGLRKGSISVTGAFGSPSADLSGVGGTPQATLNPTTLTFAKTTVGTPAPPQTITLTNGGDAPTIILAGQISISGPNASDFPPPTSNCVVPTGIAPGATCTITVTYNPKAAGASTATLSVVSNVGTTSTATLNGTAEAATLTLTVKDTDSSSSQTVAAGATATYNLSVSGDQSVTATIACSGAPTAATCTPSPASVAVTPTTAGTLKVTVSTTARGAVMPFNQPSTKMQPPTFLQIAPLASLALLFVIAMMLGSMQTQAGRQRTLRVALSLCLILMPIAAATVLVGCGGGSSSTTPPPATGTPAGTYTITVTATSGSTSSAPLQLTLVVN